MRIAFGALAPRGGGLADGDRRDSVRAVVEVKNVRVQTEGFQQGSVRKQILSSVRHWTACETRAPAST